MPSSISPGLDASDVVLYPSDGLVLTDGDLDCGVYSSSRSTSSKASMFIDLSISLVNLTLLLVEIGFLVSLFFSFSF